MREMIAQYLPCYQTPTAVFLSPPVSNDSKQSSNSMTEKWSTMSADPPRTERLPGSARSTPQGQLPALGPVDAPAAGFRPGAGIRGSERPRRAAVGPGAANGGGRRGAAQHPARTVVAVQLLSTPGAVLCRSRAPAARISELRRTPRMTRPWTNPSRDALTPNPPDDLITLQNDQDIAAHNLNAASNDPAPARSELSRPATAQISRIPAKLAHSCNIRASCRQ